MKIKLRFFLLAVISLSAVEGFSQRGKDGAKTVAAAVIVNEYTSLTANAAAGATTISVAASTMNANGRFSGNLTAGDLILIIQLQGVSISARDSNQWDPFESPRDSSWGMIHVYNNCGNWEFAEIYSVPSGTSITLDCGLKNNYTSAGRVVVVRVPRYSSLTVNNGGTISCDPWNGTVGGVCAIEVQGNTTINSGGSIDGSGKGFRGAQLLENLSLYGTNEAAQKGGGAGAEKGEGVGGYQSDYDIWGGRYGKGAPGNGGGGGNDHNGGGGGGANAGDTSLWNGNGNPDNTMAAWTTAWNLQWTNFSANTSSGGGRGGYTFSANNKNPTTTGPGNAAWGGDLRRAWGGYGGRPLDYSTGRLFLGGGGGSGDQDNNKGGAGANGGALMYLMNYGTISGAGNIISNGNIGTTSGIDGGGGGGGGGTIVLNSVGTISGITATANGGNGGNQNVSAFVTEAEGPGGGGGGGYIAVSNGAITKNVNGGANGTTNSSPMSQFIPNGATKGGAGKNNATVTNFIINAPNVTICAGQSATLNATLSGTVPAGTTIIWYDNLVAGNVLGNGNSYTTPVLAAGTYSYYVGTCPGTYHQPVIVTVTNTTPISAGADVTICTGGNTTLNASGAATYAWSPSGNLSNPNISNPVANPASTTTYVVTGTSSCGTNTDTMIVTVGTMSASISGNTTICPGGSTTLTASGGNNYLWSTTQTTSSIIVSPTANTNYSVTVSSGSCSTSTSVTVTIGSAINASITGGNVTVCTGSNVSLSASGGTNYSWNTAQTTSSIVVSPTANSTYSVFVSSGSCADTATTSITVSSGITASINGPAAICSGGNATLTASGGNNYSWNTAQTTSSIVVSPTANSTYSVFVSSGSCADTTSITVNVGSSITALVTANSTICSGQNATLTASGGSNYSWTTGNTNASINVSPTANTTYSVIVSSGSCADTASTVVSVAPAPALSLSGNTSICIGDVSTITASGGNNYSWSTGATTTSVLLSPTTTTNYSVTAFGALCDSTAPFTITVVPQANVTVSPNTTICAGASTTLSAQGGATYSWSTTQTTSSIIISPTATSTYSVIGGFGSCKDTATVTVFVSPSPTVSITSNPSPASICSGASATLNATGGGNYSWSNSSLTSSTTVSPNATTTYTVFVTSNGCTSTATATVNVIATPSVNIAGNPNICSGTPTILTAQGATNYSWSTGQSSTSITVSSSGTYSVFAAIGTCTTSSSITVNTAPSPTATVSAPVIITQGGSANLTAGGGVNYVWDNGMNGQNITVSPSVTTVYCVTVYDNNGCQDSACTKVMVEVCSGEPYFPNAFSPNGDGDNDSLMVYYNIPDCIKKLHLVIYNRWGEKVYETSDVNFRWNGNYTTSLIKGAGETEVLAFYLDIEIAGGTSISKKGNVSLIR